MLYLFFGRFRAVFSRFSTAFRLFSGSFCSVLDVFGPFFMVVTPFSLFCRRHRRGEVVFVDRRHRRHRRRRRRRRPFSLGYV